MKENGWLRDLGLATTVVFNQTGQNVQSARYIYAPKRISIAITNTYTPNVVDSVIGGNVLIWGRADGGTWERITTVHIARTTKDIVRTIDLDSTKQWIQFRMDYTHLGGYGGAILSNWTAYFGMKIDYLYPLEDNTLYAPASELVFRDLTPGTTYYYAMQCFEEKGCERHVSALSAPISITTKAVPENPRLVVRRDKDGKYSVELPEMADGLHTLAIYDYNGHLVYQTKPNYGTTIVALPSMNLGHTYMLKYFTGRMGRKDLNTKVLYY